MSAMEKSDLPEVARKRANKAVSTAAEPVERRGGTKENADLQSTVRTQSREAVSNAQARIREAVTRNRPCRPQLPAGSPGFFAAHGQAAWL
jgi:RNA-directed DNA polymerase